MNSEAKTYSEYKKQFESEEDFLWELGQLSEVEARKLIENEDTSVTAKAGMFATWKKAHAELDGVMEFIESYERGDTVADIAVEVGYVCG